MSSAAFMSHDGEDANGVRAEVYVQTGSGKIVEIEDSNESARVVVKNPALKHKVAGWIRTDDPLFAKVAEAHEAGRDIEYRIESQRKKHVARDAPMKELRKNMEAGRENTTLLFVGLNGELGAEAVTHPSEDLIPGGRVPAKPVQEAPTGAPAAAPRTEGGPLLAEEGPWKPYNSDGSPNLGSATVAAVVGVEAFTRKTLIAQEDTFLPDGDQEEELVLRLTEGILHIADAVQVRANNLFGRHSRPDRNANSHTRIRHLLFDTIENYFPFPVKNLEMETEAFDQWRYKVGSLTTQRLTTILRLAYPDAFQGQTQQATASDRAPEPPESMLAPLGHEADGNKASDETIAMVRELFTDAEVEDFSRITPLFRYTFGVDKAADIPDSLLSEFVDHYVAEGSEALREAVNYAVNTGK